MCEWLLNLEFNARFEGGQLKANILSPLYLSHNIDSWQLQVEQPFSCLPHHVVTAVTALELAECIYRNHLGACHVCDKSAGLLLDTGEWPLCLIQIPW